MMVYDRKTEFIKMFKKSKKCICFEFFEKILSGAKNGSRREVWPRREGVLFIKNKDKPSPGVRRLGGLEGSELRASLYTP